jgi:AcrR family transcriptional regulator
VSESSFYQRAQSEKDLLQAFLQDHDANWLRWFQREIDAKFETTKGGLEIVADVMRKWFENSRLQCAGVNTVVCPSRQFAGETLELLGNQRDQLRRFVEQLVVKMGLRYPDIAATASVQIIERTIVRTLKSGDLSEIKTAQLLFQCLQRALSAGLN